jgi:hypothetical protein
MLGGLTNHATLLMYKRSEVAEYLRELVYASLNLPNLSFALLDEGLLVSEFVWRELGLHGLGLQLLGCSFRALT